MYLISKRLFFLLFLMSSTLSAQNLEFSEAGLNVLPLNSKIEKNSLSTYFSEIDTTTIHGLLEYSGAVYVDYDETLDLYLKVDLDKYKLPTYGIKYIYIGLKDYEIRKIVVKLLDEHSLRCVINLFNQLFTPSLIMGTEIDTDIYSSKLWESEQYEVLLSGISKIVVFTCRK